MRGSPSTSLSAATASPGRSCRPRHSLRRTRTPATTTSTRPSRATSAAAAPTFEFAPPSSKRQGHRRLPRREPDMETVSRRDFVVAIAAAGGGLLLGCRVGGHRSLTASSETASTTPPAFVPNAFVRIGSDGRVTLIMNQVEMGQGIYTAMPMLIAEELEVGLDQVVVEPAPPDDKLYANPIFGFQSTGGSTSVRAMFTPLRKAGAAARTMLVAAAAQTWGVAPASCRAEKGVVTHGP